MRVEALALLLLLAVGYSNSSDLEPYPSVYVTEGQVKGKIEFSRGERKFVTFLGIPYAKPPGRFQPAEPPEPWIGLRDCTYFRDLCPQWSEESEGSIVGSEDCLYLNVFMPTFEKPSKRLLPVMVFIGDENFQQSGPPDKYGPEYLMDQDVILVTLSYRLGALGFLTTEDGELPGNLGLKDQVMALRWLQSNIHIFGGDRMRVTLFGSGTGSIAVSLHLLSPMSSDLFSGAISQSGSFSCPNALVFQPHKVASEFGAQLGCQGNSSVELANCVKSKNVSEILSSQANITGWEKGKLVTPFGPSVELEIDIYETATAFPQNSGRFLPDYPENLVQLGRFRKVPWVVGVNSKAGYSKLISCLKHNITLMDLLNRNWTSLAQLLFQFSDTALSPSAVAAKVREFYFFNHNVSEENLIELYNALSDHKYFYCVKQSVLKYAAYAPVFPYYFTYQRVNYMRLPEVNGVAHREELQYLFTIKTAEGGRQTIEKRSRAFPFSLNVVRLWASFAEHGAPIETWPHRGDWLPLSHFPGKTSTIKWYRLDSDCSYISEPFFARAQFWQQQQTMWKLQLAQNAHWQRRKLQEEKEQQRDNGSGQTLIFAPFCSILTLFLFLLKFHIIT